MLFFFIVTELIETVTSIYIIFSIIIKLHCYVHI